MNNAFLYQIHKSIKSTILFVSLLQNFAKKAAIVYEELILKVHSISKLR